MQSWEIGNERRLIHQLVRDANRMPQLHSPKPPVILWINNRGERSTNQRSDRDYTATEKDGKSRHSAAILNRQLEPDDFLAVYAYAPVAHMDLPGFRLHPLKGKEKGFWAVTVRAIWRVIFRFDGDAQDVDYVDYH